MSEFNFKSQPYTTIEQSQRLIALGLKVGTADCCHWYCISCVDEPIERENIPAWSLHRLLELNLLCCEQHFAFQFHITNIDDAYEYLINHTEWLINEGYFNKEYLCDK